MYKLILISFLFLDVFFAGAQPQDIGPFGKCFYVSPTGSDLNPGTKDMPLASFEGAKKVVSKFKSSGKDIPVTVLFRSGEYYITKAAVFTPADGGTKSAAVKYMAYPGEEVVIVGGKSLELEWKPFKERIFMARVPDGLVFEALYINGEKQILARYPNFNSHGGIFNGTAADCISKKKVRQWKNPAGGYFHVMHKALWGDFHFRITGKDKKGNLTMEGGWQNNRPENGLNNEYRYVENIFEELDAEKEWYLDRNKGILYLKPAKGTDLAKSDVEVAYLDNFITLKGTDKKPVRYLSFEGFHFMRTVRTFMKTRDRLLRSDWAIYRGGAIYFEGTEHCSVVNCELSQLGGNAVFFNSYNRYSSISECHIHDIGANAICFVGDTSAVRNAKFVPYGHPVSNNELDLTSGPKSELYPSFCIADNNLIHDIGKVEKQVAGVEISISAFITVSRNSIYDCPRAGINIGEGAFGGHLIEFNDVFNTVLETADHGSFNSWGRDRFWMRVNSRTERRVESDRSVILLDIMAPTVICNNRMRCDHGWDIDLDDGSSYYKIYNNICLHGGIKLREGYYRTVENNICVNNSLHPHVWLKNSGDVVRGNIFGSSMFPIQIKYWGTEVDYNWYPTETALKKTQEFGVDKHGICGNPEFEDPANGNFNVKNNSKVFELGWKNFPMDKFGVQKGELKKLAKQPDIPPIKIVDTSSAKTYPLWGGVMKNLETDGEVSATGMYDKTGVLIVKKPINGIAVNFNLKIGDVILEVNNNEIKNMAELTQRTVADGVRSITVWRNQQKVILKK